MKKSEVIKNATKFVKNRLNKESSGHDWWHVYRVWKMAKNIGQKEEADMFVVELAALLHDIADYKMHDGDDSVGPRIAREWLIKQSVDAKIINHVCKIIKDASFKGAKVKAEINTIEGKIVQDADRLDALGAIGIGRTFAFGGAKGREMYNPEIKPKMHKSFDQYKKSNSPTINHFYEKLLLLKDLMNTESGKKIARKRHIVMEKFLKDFFNEWEGKT
jgi:uncharacterized protein